MKMIVFVPLSSGLADPFAYPPMGPLMIAGVLKQHGHECDILFVSHDYETDTVKVGRDRNLARYKSMRSVPFEDYDVVGVNIFAEATFDAARAVCREIPAWKWVVGGGAFVTSGTDEALAIGIDVAVIDEGEGQIIDVLNVLGEHEDKSSPMPRDFYSHMGGIGGIAFVDSNGSIRKTPHRAYLKELDSLPYPAWERIERDLVAQKTHIHLGGDKTQTTVFATRGCPWDCTFCNREMGGRTFRMHSPDYIVDHLNFLRDQYGVSHVRFPDDMFTTNKKWVIEISQKLKANDFTWVALSRTDVLDDELAEAMSDGGCKGLFFGIESGSDRILGLMRKRTTAEKNAEAIRRCRDYWMQSSCYFIFGFPGKPGEDAESVNETLCWLRDARPSRAHYSTFQPIHGTDPHRTPEVFGIKIKEGYRNWHYHVDDLDTEFPVEYLPPNLSNPEMLELRKYFESGLTDLGFMRWKEKASVSQPEPI